VAARKKYAEDIYRRSRRGLVEQHGPSAQIQTESEKSKRGGAETKAVDDLVKSFRTTQETRKEKKRLLAAMKEVTEEAVESSKESPAPETKSETENS